MAEREIKLSDVKICRERYSKDKLLNVKSVPVSLDTMCDDGSWDDLIYDGKTASRAFNHTYRMLEIAKAIYDPESEICGDKNALIKLEKAINLWIDRDIYYTDNWWYNTIATPMCFGDILLATGNLLSSETEKRALEYLRGKIETNERGGSRSTGANTYTRQKVRLAYALYTYDLERIRSIFDIVASEIKMVTKEGPEYDFKRRIWDSYVKLPHLPDTKEGMQVDHSYLFHGPMLLSGSYGKELITSLSSFLYYSKGTSLFPMSDLSDFTDMLLEHYRWLIRGQTFDYTTLGRAISSGAVHASARSAADFLGGLKILAERDDLPRQDEITKFYENTQHGVPTIIGHKHFWKADFTSHQEDSFLLTLRASSNRTIASEQVNTENLLCDFLGDGVTYIYRDGAEYDRIFDVWDWHKIPGTTTLMKKFDPPMIQHRAIRGSESDDVGGVSDGRYGATAMQLSRDGLRAKKAWFMFDNGFLALGTEIINESGIPHITTVNQSVLRSEVHTSDNEMLAPSPEHSRTLTWVHHDKTGYFFPEPTRVKLGIESNKLGDRRDINLHGAYKRPEEPESAVNDLFSLWYDHTDITNEKAYSYFVLPEAEKCDMYGASPFSYIHILENNSSLQAVENAKLGTLQAVFWNENANLTASSGIKLSVDKKLLLQLRHDGNALILAVASLPAEGGTVNIRINKALEGIPMQNGESIISLTLPEGEYRGQSIVKKFNIK